MRVKAASQRGETRKAAVVSRVDLEGRLAKRMAEWARQRGLEGRRPLEMPCPSPALQHWHD